MQFQDIIGQQEVKNLLIQTVNDQRISHAQLFLGPEGSVNLAMAVAYAQYISCKNRTSYDSCGQCPSCKKYNKLIHPDLHFAVPVATNKEVDKHPITDKFLNCWRPALLENPYLNLFQWMECLEVENKQLIINAEECDEIVKKLALKPYESEYKVMIIWLPEKLFHAAAPKLLKALEEPAAKTLFILVSENYAQILPTILSRTQLVKFGRLKDEEIYRALVSKYSLDPENANYISGIAEGNYLEAIKLASDSDGESFNQQQFLPWMRLCFSAYEKENMISLIDKTEEFARIGRERQKSFLSYCLRLFRDCLMLNYSGWTLAKLNGKQLEEIRKFAKFINEENILPLTEEFNTAISDVERNANPKILFMDLSLKTAALLRIKMQLYQR